MQRHPLQLAVAGHGRDGGPGHPGAVAAAGLLRRAANDPAASTTHQAYELLATGFGPGFNGPLQLVGTTDSPADAAALARLAGTLRTEPGIAAVAAPVPGHGAALISVVPTTSPDAAATSTLISHLRDSVIPAAEHGTTLRVYVGGATATNGDFATVITAQAAALHRRHPRPGVPAADAGLPQPAGARGQRR